MIWRKGEVIHVEVKAEGNTERVNNYYLCVMKIVKLFLAALAVYSISFTATAQGGPDVIVPKVASFTVGSDVFLLEAGAGYSLKTSKGIDKADADRLEAYLSGRPLSLTKVAKGASISLRVGAGQLLDKRQGAYHLEVSKKGIIIRSNDCRGAFYALQSLIQMKSSGSGLLQACSIDDAPQMAWRGVMFDVVRHFRSKEAVLRQLDVLALAKINIFHFHITDNEGWRIRLDCCPDVAEKTAFGNRDFFYNVLSGGKYQYEPQPMPEGYISGTYYDDGKVCGGFYSKDDIREIVEYAAQRHIEVVPEIEMPGHSRALLKARPELACDHFSGIDNVVCAGLDNTFTFFEQVLEEVFTLFPSGYIHIGGDEADKDNWADCSRCRARMERENLKNTEELQSWFIRRIEPFINTHGRRLIGWDEILQGGLSDNATVMSWRGSAGGVTAISQEHDVIMTPNTYYYIDYCQDAPYKEPIAFNIFQTLRWVYGYSPVDDIKTLLGDKFDPSLLGHLLGVQTNLWTETVIDDGYFEYMLYPRVFAMAETGWSAADKDYDNFRERTLGLLKILDSWGISHFDLAHEEGDRPESVRRISHLAPGANVRHERLDGRQVRRSIPVLSDGMIGGWNVRDTTVWYSVRGGNNRLETDLGKVQDIHYIGAELAEYPIRKRRIPEVLSFSVSEDGATWTAVDVAPVKLDPDRRRFLLMTVGKTVAIKARFVRLETTGRHSFYISELIVN